MIRTSVIISAALALAACGKDKAAEANQAFSDEDFTQSAIVANDVTAIDAATGDAANMAADVPADMTFDNQGSDQGDGAAAASRSDTLERRASRATPATSGKAVEPAPGAAPAATAPSPAAVPANGNSVG